MQNERAHPPGLKITSVHVPKDNLNIRNAKKRNKKDFYFNETG